jgi:hypothetical protein
MLPVRLHGCANEGSAFVQLPFKAKISDVRYYTSAQQPSDVPGWYNDTGDPRKIDKVKNKAPLIRVKPDVETYFFIIHRYTVDAQAQNDMQWVNAWIGNRNNRTWRYAAIEVDWSIP